MEVTIQKNLQKKSAFHGVHQNKQWMSYEFSRCKRRACISFTGLQEGYRFSPKKMTCSQYRIISTVCDLDWQDMVLVNKEIITPRQAAPGITVLFLFKKPDTARHIGL